MIIYGHCLCIIIVRVIPQQYVSCYEVVWEKMYRNLAKGAYILKRPQSFLILVNNFIG
jgi:hypothetical protein